MDFFQKHDKALRKGRLLQAAATIWTDLTKYKDANMVQYAVSIAFQLERELEKELELRG